MCFFCYSEQQIQPVLPAHCVPLKFPAETQREKTSKQTARSLTVEEPSHVWCSLTEFQRMFSSSTSHLPPAHLSITQSRDRAVRTRSTGTTTSTSVRLKRSGSSPGFRTWRGNMVCFSMITAFSDKIMFFWQLRTSTITHKRKWHLKILIITESEGIQMCCMIQQIQPSLKGASVYLLWNFLSSTSFLVSHLFALSCI